MKVLVPLIALATLAIGVALTVAVYYVLIHFTIKYW